MLSGIGPTEVVLVLVLALLVLGPKRLPEVGRSVGRGMREFKDSISGRDGDGDAPALTAAEPDAAPQPVPVPERAAA